MVLTSAVAIATPETPFGFRLVRDGVEFWRLSFRSEWLRSPWVYVWKRFGVDQSRIN